MKGRDGKERKGATRWCNRCSRYHPSQVSCNLVRVTRIAKSGKKTARLVQIRRVDE